MSPEEAAELVRSQMPLCATLGVSVVTFEASSVVLCLDWAPELCTSGGLLHGGAIMALADSAGGGLAWLNLPEGSIGTATITSSTNFVGAVRDGTVTATASLLHAGRSTIVVETVVADAGGRTIAKVTQTQSVLR